jgi:hypothetical protein
MTRMNSWPFAATRTSPLASPGGRGESYDEARFGDLMQRQYMARASGGKITNFCRKRLPG